MRRRRRDADAAREHAGDERRKKQRAQEIEAAQRDVRETHDDAERDRGCGDEQKRGEKRVQHAPPMQHADERLRAGESADDRRPAARRVSMRAAIATPEGGQIDAALARWKPAEASQSRLKRRSAFSQLADFSQSLGIVLRQNTA